MKFQDIIIGYARSIQSTGLNIKQCTIELGEGAYTLLKIDCDAFLKDVNWISVSDFESYHHFYEKDFFKVTMYGITFKFIKEPNHES